jgi:hypothetical protein
MTVAVDKEFWIKMKNETLSSEKTIHLWKSNHEPQHPWSIWLENILHDRKVIVDNVANSFEEGMVRVKEHLDKAKELGFIVIERRV